MANLAIGEPTKVSHSSCLYETLIIMSIYPPLISLFDSTTWHRFSLLSRTIIPVGLVIAIPEIPISGFPEIPFSPKSRNSGIFQAKIPEIRDFHFLHYLL